MRVEVRREVTLPGQWSSRGAAHAVARAGPRAPDTLDELAGPLTAGRASGPGSVARGYRNGRIPDRALCELSFAAGQRLRCDAAGAFEHLNGAYRAAFGRDLAVRDSYRSYEEQVAVAASRGALAAPPGTSNHGWGQAVDLGGGIQYFGSAEHGWMAANARAYGWTHPAWAGTGGVKPEAWHWEYGTGG
ncbi:hypothetical protein HGK34_16875 [Myceligenerans sp. I2]|uniref:D-alanyl-D-alanine carboxypeptidase-like core domain-containing protein n=1 Tax=Myceligenerans indicum TaxID=2593663 RepID=A0ABS1LNV0_9MICO|nr:hypothetical protein [Myceligenerans indicum]